MPEPNSQERLNELKTEEQKLINRMTEIRGADNALELQDEFKRSKTRVEEIQPEIQRLNDHFFPKSGGTITEEQKQDQLRQMQEGLDTINRNRQGRNEDVIKLRENIRNVLREEGYAPNELGEARRDDLRELLRGNARFDERTGRIIRIDDNPNDYIMRDGDKMLVNMFKGIGGHFNPDSEDGRSEVTRTFLAQTAASGGNLIPDDTTFQEKFHMVLKDFGGLDRVATVWRRPTGRDIPLNMLDDTKAGNAGTHAEGTDDINAVTVGGSGSNIELTARTLKANAYDSGKIPYTWEFEDDYPMALLQLSKLAGTRVARKYTADYVSGTGTGLIPRGVLTDAAKGLDLSFDKSDNFFKNGHRIIGDIADAIDWAYASSPGGSVVMNQYTLTELRTIPGTDGHPLYPELQWKSRENQPMIGNMPVQIDNNYPSVDKAAANRTSKIITVGDHREYWVLEVTGIRTITDPLSSYGKIYYILVVRRGGILVDKKAVKHVLATTVA